MTGTNLQPSVSETPLFARSHGSGADGSGGLGEYGGKRASAGANAAQSAFRFVDLFAGIGGLRRGFEPLGGKCVLTSEWNRHALIPIKVRDHPFWRL